MFPTRPRLSSRSICSSCTAPCSVTATRVCCGVTLIRICSFIGTHGARTPRLPSIQGCWSPLGYDNSEFREELRRLEERQPHDPGVAAFDALDEGAGAALDGVGARLVERLAGLDVGGEALGGHRAEGHERF